MPSAGRSRAPWIGCVRDDRNDPGTHLSSCKSHMSLVRCRRCEIQENWLADVERVRSERLADEHPLNAE